MRSKILLALLVFGVIAFSASAAYDDRGVFYGTMYGGSNPIVYTNMPMMYAANGSYGSYTPSTYTVMPIMYGTGMLYDPYGNLLNVYYHNGYYYGNNYGHMYDYDYRHHRYRDSDDRHKHTNDDDEEYDD
jgi:hypothetical protein